jgi:hypothetical protein
VAEVVPPDAGLILACPRPGVPGADSVRWTTGAGLDSDVEAASGTCVELACFVFGWDSVRCLVHLESLDNSALPAGSESDRFASTEMDEICDVVRCGEGRRGACSRLGKGDLPLTSGLIVVSKRSVSILEWGDLCRVTSYKVEVKTRGSGLVSCFAEIAGCDINASESMLLVQQ